MSKSHLTPPALFDSRRYGFSQIVTACGGTTVYLSGQVGWDAEQQLVGRDDLGGQMRRALQNIETALEVVGGSRDDVVSLRIYLVGPHIHQGGPVREALLDFFDPERLPTSTWIGVTALANPDFLVEVEAMAVIEDQPQASTE